MTFNDIRNDVRNFYERNKDVFTRPSVEDCIDYAITEGAEALDALLRIKRSKDVRRTSKEIDFDAEVGDMKFMMVACVLDDPDEWWDYLPEYMQAR